MVLPMGKDVQLWDEFHPTLYKLTATLTQANQSDTREIEFGMRTFTIQGRWFYVNGRKTMLRGTVENCDFPLTGYPNGCRKLGARIPYLPELRFQPHAVSLLLPTGSCL